MYCDILGKVYKYVCEHPEIEKGSDSGHESML